MDIISFIPGIGPTGAFTPGANTPAPFNVSHTGAVDGSNPSTSTNNMAEIYNRILLQLQAVIVTAGLTVDHANWTQLGTAIQTMIASGAFLTLAQYATDFTHSNVVNGYQEFPGGRIEQSYEVAVTAIADGEVTIVYPIAFPTQGRIPVPSVKDPGRVGDESNALILSVISNTNTGCVIALGQNGGGARNVTLHIDVSGW